MELKTRRPHTKPFQVLQTSTPRTLSRSQILPLTQDQCQGTFVAIDFETANRARNSACSVGLVRVENGAVARVYTQLIRPPEMDFEFSYIHGIGPRDVQYAPTFEKIHTDIRAIRRGPIYSRRNAPFDASVLKSLCSYWSLPQLLLPWVCTVRLACSAWGLYPTKLPDVCTHLNIPLNHHDATSDATACAKIILAYGNS